MLDHIPEECYGSDADRPDVVALSFKLGSAFHSAAHSHLRGQLIGCSRGVITVATEAASWAISPGHAIWLPPGESHGGRSFGPTTGWTAYLSADVCDVLSSSPCIVEPSALLREAILHAAAWEDDAVDVGRQRVADLIVDQVRRLPPRGLGLPMPKDARLLWAARALLARPSDASSLKEWAARAGTTSRTLSRRFPQETGLSFAAWRQRARLMHALQMLAEGEPVTAVALDLGYSSVSGFIALFRRTFGVTPGQHQNGHMDQVGPTQVDDRLSR